MMVIRDYQFQRIIRAEKGILTGKIISIRDRHKIAQSMQTFVVESTDDKGQVWLIQSSCSEKIQLYTIRRNRLACDCSLQCTECKHCIHNFMCTCYDFTIGNNMCKHIHYLMMSKKLEPYKSDMKRNEDEIEMHISTLSCQPEASEKEVLISLKETLIHRFNLLISNCSLSQARKIEKIIDNETKNTKFQSKIPSKNVSHRALIHKQRDVKRPRRN